MSKILIPLSFNSYKKLEELILKVSIERKVVIIYFLKNNSLLTKSLEKELESNYYKISSINEEIVKISPEKYEELVSHVLMNILFNSYSPNKKDIRLLNGMIIYAYQNKRTILYILLNLILYKSINILKFNNLKNVNTFGSVVQNIFSMLECPPSFYFKNNTEKKQLNFVFKKGTSTTKMNNKKFQEENQIEIQEKIIEMKEYIIELDEQIIELQELHFERQENQIELREIALETDSE